jgi:D-alanyl-D-alanine carboxypeptidase (penicillin-binding protein 5/6)
LAQQGLTQPKPIASITKIVTALTILQKKPLHGDETGPKITITKADQALYDAYVAIDGSVVPVRVGEQLTELQMLQAMLLPSANNLADTLAIWAFGSLDSHIRAANAYVTSLGMSHTKITDASGISATTVSTASDLIKLGEAAMRQPIIARIVSQTEVAFPVVQKIYNVNGMLGRDGIIGIKPGNTDEAGGCFLGAAAVTLPGGKHLTVLTAVLGAPNLVQALVDSRHLLASIPSGFGKIEVLPSQASVGYLNIPWGQPVSIKSQQPLVINDWLGRSYEPVIKMKSLRGSQTAGSIAGTAEILTPDGVKRTNLVLESAVMEPPSGWRRANIF